MNKQLVDKSELDNMLQIAIKQVEDLGIEFKGKIVPKIRIYKATSYFGLCRDRGRDIGYEITISEYHLKSHKHEVMDTMVHEVLHVAKGTNGHCSRWNKYVNMVNSKYGYNISRVGTKEDGRIFKEVVPKYIVRCKSCGTVFKRMRKSNMVSYPFMYICGECDNGELERIK